MPKKKKPARKKKRLTNFQQATKKFKNKSLKQLSGKKPKPRVDPLWTLEDGVTYSLLSKFETCRHRFHISKVQGWKPRKINLPLEFGNIFHHMIEAQERGVLPDKMIRLATNYVNQKIKDKQRSNEEIKELSMLAAIAAVTFEHYVAYWEQNCSLEWKGVGRYEKNFNWIGKEVSFDVNYQLPNGRKLRLRGVKDGRFNIDRKTEGNWVLETKTKGDIDEGGITAGLHKDMHASVQSQNQVESTLHLDVVVQEPPAFPQLLAKVAPKFAPLRPKGPQYKIQVSKSK